MRTVIVFFYCFCFMGCQVDPGSKKETHLEKLVSTLTNVYNPAVDILFIIDDSGSMESVQELLAKNAELFIDRFLNTEFIDYHISVTSSSALLHSRSRTSGHPDAYNSPTQISSPRVYGGDLMRCKNLAEERKYPYFNYVDRDTPEGDRCLSEMMRVGLRSPGPEEFFTIPMLALSGKMLIGKNFNFYRPEAHLAVFVITDSYDQSGLVPQEAYKFLLDLKKGDEKKIHYAAGIVTSQVFQYDCKNEEEPPTNFIEMVELFKDRGYQFNLCQFNYGKDIAHFANHLVDSVLSIPLDRLPNVDSMEVRYNYKGGSQLVPNGPGGWTYDTESNIVHLSKNIQLEKTEGKFSVNYEPFFTSKWVNF